MMLKIASRLAGRLAINLHCIERLSPPGTTPGRLLIATDDAILTATPRLSWFYPHATEVHRLKAMIPHHRLKAMAPHSRLRAVIAHLRSRAVIAHFRLRAMVPHDRLGAVITHFRCGSLCSGGDRRGAKRRGNHDGKQAMDSCHWGPPKVLSKTVSQEAVFEPSPPRHRLVAVTVHSVLD
jgi:hypothetical protein